MPQHLNIHNERRNSASFSGLVNKLIYLPGAAVIIYGIWLSLTV